VKQKKRLTVEDVKRLATPDEKELYSYVTDRAEIVSSEIAKLIDNAEPGKGGIVLVHGSQNSGKTIVALLSMSKLESLGYEVGAFQPDVDRPDVPKGRFFSRSGFEKEVISFSKKTEISGFFGKYPIVLVDEVHFIPHDLQIHFFRELMAFTERGGWAVLIGILPTAQGGEFLLSAVIKERATVEYELTATCQKCGRRGARWNQRLVDGVPSGSEDPDLLAPSERVVYEPRCDECRVIIG